MHFTVEVPRTHQILPAPVARARLPLQVTRILEACAVVEKSETPASLFLRVTYSSRKDRNESEHVVLTAAPEKRRRGSLLVP